MNNAATECLPIAQVIEKVAEVESALERFYDSALERVSDEDVRLIMTQLRKSKPDSVAVVRRVCAAAACGSAVTAAATGRDLDFLSTLVQSAFFDRTGPLADLLDPSLQTSHLVDNALKLERDLLLFYLKFYAVSCEPHRPLFRELIRRSEDDVTELANLRIRLRRAAR